MKVYNLYLEDFRNYRAATAKFSDGVNVITGQNAQGKTNMLEAVYYMTAGRSFRAAADKDLISLRGDKACIRADIVSSDREQILEAKLYRGRRREIFANGVKLKKASELAGRLSAVMFNPDELDMIKDGAVVRRRILDNCLSQLRPLYAAALSEFNRLHEHKTRILRGYHEKPSLLDLLDDFNYRIAEQSAQLIYYRSALTKVLAGRASAIHRDFSGGIEKLEINYKTVGGMDADGMKPGELLPILLEHQKNHRQAELRSGVCLTGAHKDDLEICINDVPARKFASQGQARTAAVSIKLAERDIHFEDRGEYPILLLDDVLSELDSNRQSFVMGRIKNGQVLITCCDEQQAGKLTNGRLIRVEGGAIV